MNIKSSPGSAKINSESAIRKTTTKTRTGFVISEIIFARKTEFKVRWDFNLFGFEFFFGLKKLF